MAKEDIHRLLLKLPQDMWKAVVKASKEKEMSASEYIRVAIDEKWFREHRPK